jgi:hypothetical protein
MAVAIEALRSISIHHLGELKSRASYGNNF